MRDGMGIGDAVMSPVSEVLARLVVGVARTALAAKDVLIERDSFRGLSKYLEKIRPILREMLDKKVSDSGAMLEALLALEVQLRKAEELIHKCSTKSKFYLLVNCRTFVKEIQDVTREIGRCLSLIPLANLSLAVETRDRTTKLYTDMQRAQFKATVAEETIIDKIDNGIRNRQTNSEYSNGLLLEIAKAVGVKSDPASLKDELDMLKREKEDAQARKNQQEMLQLEQIIALLSRADAATSITEKNAIYQKKRGSGGREGHPLPPLQSFYCPITQEVMEEPVEIASGQTFERSAIEIWLEKGNRTCPTTKVELENTEIKVNLALKQSIQEWKERVTASSIAAMKVKLDNDKSSESEISSALRTLLNLSDEKGIHRYWIAMEGIIPVLVKLLQDSRRNIRKETLELLRSLAVDNAENKVNIASEADAIRQVVKSLARDLGEGQQAVALLRELSKDPEICEKIGKVQGCILLLVTMLNTDSRNAVLDAKELLHQLGKNDQNVVQMGEANYFGPLIKRLNEGPDMTKILMASALSRLFLTDQSKEVLAQQGAVQPLVKMLALGNLEAKTAALGALQKLSTIPGNREYLIQAGVIPPILQLLSSVTSVAMTLKENAAATLANMAMASTSSADTRVEGHGNSLESYGTIFQLLSLLNLEGPVIQGHLLRALLGMSSLSNAQELRVKMQDRGAIQLLLPFCENSNDEVRVNAVKLLYCLSSDGAGKELADQLGDVPMRALVKILAGTGDNEEKVAAAGIISNLPLGQRQVTEMLLHADALPAVTNLLVVTKGSKGGGPRAARNVLTETAAGALLHFTSPGNVLVQQRTAELNAIPLLVQLLQTGTPLAKFRAATALGQLSESSAKLTTKERTPNACFMWCKPAPVVGCSVHQGRCSVKSSFCLVMANALVPLVQTLEEREEAADEAALYALGTLLLDESHLENGVKLIEEAGGVRQIVRLLTVGTVGAKEQAVSMLEKIFRIDVYKTEYGNTAQMPLIDLTQKGTNATRPLAAKILAQLNILHNQSSYF